MMNNTNAWSFLRLFDAELVGEAETASLTAPETEHTGDNQQEPPDAGEQSKSETREERFRALMEGEYKDLFTAYFQETFNRRFKEQKGKMEELERTRAVVAAAAERFGTTDTKALIAALSEKSPQTVQENATVEEEQRLHEAVTAAVQRAKAETELAVLSSIRARGLRPAENGTAFRAGIRFDNAAKNLSRAERAEIARRVSKGETVKI